MKVLELSVGGAAAFAGMVLAELREDVIRVESDALAEVQGHGGAGLLSEHVDEHAGLYLHRGKRTVVVDLTEEEGREALARVAAECDVLVEDLGAGGLERLGTPPESLRRHHPGLHLIRLSPFGQSGPRAGWRATELVVQALGGIVQSTGFADDPPLRVTGMPAQMVGGLNAAIAAHAAVSANPQVGDQGMDIDISLEETFAELWQRHLAQWAYSGYHTTREPRGFGRQGFPHTAMSSDGWLYMLALHQSWDEVAAFFGLDAFIGGPWEDPEWRREHASELGAAFEAVLATRTKEEWFVAAAERGYTFAPVLAPADLLTHPQYAVRSYFDRVVVDREETQVPGLPFPWPGVQGPRAPAQEAQPAETLVDSSRTRAREGDPDQLRNSGEGDDA